MSRINNSLKIKSFADLLTDIMSTEKSFNQEVRNTQIPFITNQYLTKTDMVYYLQKFIPDLQIKGIKMVRLVRTQQSRKSGSYTIQSGSTRSHVKGHKKFLITFKDSTPLVNYFANIQATNKVENEI